MLNKKKELKLLSDNPTKELLLNSLMKFYFILIFKVDPTILGGLQMYSGNTFMECTLSARVQKIKGELQRLL
jgi:F-type H+-transporting ATPase subunit O